MGKRKSVKNYASTSCLPSESDEEELISAIFSVESVLPPGKSVKSRTLSLKSKKVYRDLIFRIEEFLTPQECSAWVTFGEVRGFERAFHSATRMNAHRDNGRIQFHSEEIALSIFNRVRAFLPQELYSGQKLFGCSPNIRLYKYSVGQRFGKHVDQSVRDPGSGAISEYTLLIYLNSAGESEGLEQGLTGGETIFYKGNYGDRVAVSVSPRAGMCIVHGHGERCLLHEGAPVQSGEKYLLRTDVLYMIQK